MFQGIIVIWKQKPLLKTTADLYAAIAEERFLPSDTAREIIVRFVFTRVI